jgi:type II secretory pathway pseudopilin PulG
MMNQRSESGETLVEIIMALVIIGLVVSAYFATFSTQASGSSVQRNLVTADGLLRDYAEATKSAVRANCGTSTTFTTTTTSLPTGFSVPPGSTNQCPPTVSTASPVVITVRTPNGVTRTLTIYVRCSGNLAQTGADPCTR